MNSIDKIKKQAEFFAFSKVHKVRTANFDEVFNIIINSYIQGFKDATKWNSPDEKPEKKHFHFSKKILISCNGHINCGYYNTKNNTFSVIGNEEGISFNEIDGWQHFPESIKK